MRKVATRIVAATRSDRGKVQRIDDWGVVSTYHEPKVRGCGASHLRNCGVEQ